MTGERPIPFLLDILKTRLVPLKSAKPTRVDPVQLNTTDIVIHMV